ncbi:uncharacterized protein VTP21DRAFT_243 [Calcarisporiella thermophila]|uniref:uncharacterized protein n=1 Tax=Calcarisporiella thermophila TaxID=911321 RepID=UPI003742A4E4
MYASYRSAIYIPRRSNFISRLFLAKRPISSQPKTWILSDGFADSERQCVALAKELNLPFEIKRIYLRKSLQWLPSIFQKWLIDVSSSLKGKKINEKLPWYLYSPRGDTLSQPFPRYVLASGRESVPACLTATKLSRETFSVYLRFPPLPFLYFGAVILPSFEVFGRLIKYGPMASQRNLIRTELPLSVVNPQSLAVASQDVHKSDWLALPTQFLKRDQTAPLVTFLLGGPTRECNYDSKQIERLSRAINTLVEQHSARVLVVYTDRTPSNVRGIISRGLSELGSRDASRVKTLSVDAKDGDPRAYMAALAIADRVVVSADSPSMVSDAVAAKKPVYIAYQSSSKGANALFHKLLKEKKLTRKFRPVSDRVKGQVETSIGDGKYLDAMSSFGEHDVWAFKGDPDEKGRSGAQEGSRKAAREIENMWETRSGTVRRRR